MSYAENVSLSKYNSYDEIFRKTYNVGTLNKETIDIEDDFDALLIRVIPNVATGAVAPTYQADIISILRTFATLRRMKLYPENQNTKPMEMRGDEYALYQSLFSRENLIYDALPTDANAAAANYDAQFIIPYSGHKVDKLGRIKAEFDIATNAQMASAGNFTLASAEIIINALYGTPEKRLWNGSPIDMVLDATKKKIDGLLQDEKLTMMIVNGYNSGALNNFESLDFKQAGGKIYNCKIEDYRLIQMFNSHSLFNPITYSDVLHFDFPKSIIINPTTLLYLKSITGSTKTIRIIPFYEAGVE